MKTTIDPTPHLDQCGFVCPSCNFRLLLSDLEVTMHLVEAFKHGLEQVDIKCPECNLVRAYTLTDLVWFLSGGREVRIRQTKTRHA